MRPLLTITLILYTLLGYSQDYTKLSDQNGWDKYKFGAAPSKYDELIFKETDGQNGDTYNYTGGKLKPYGGYQAFLEVGFYKNKLQEVQFLYQFDSNEEYKVIWKELDNLFGLSHELIIKMNHETDTRVWSEGNDYQLFLDHYENHVVSIRFQCWSDAIFH